MLKIDRPVVPEPQLRHGSALRFSELHSAGTEDNRDENLGHEAGGDRAADGGIVPSDLHGDYQRLPQVGNNEHGAVDTLGLGDGFGCASASGYGGNGGGAGQEGTVPADSDGADSAGADALKCKPVELPQVPSKETKETTDDRINALFSRVQALEGMVPTSGTTLKSDRWAKRNAYWFFPTLTVSLGVLVGSGLLALVAGSFVDGRIDAKLKDPLDRLRKIEDSVTRIDTRLSDFVNALLLERLRAASGNIREKLGDVNSALQVANQTGTKVESPLVQEIKFQIQKLPSTTPSYWPTVGTFVTQQTLISTGMTLKQALDAPSCPAYTDAKAKIAKPLEFMTIRTSCDGYAIDVDGWRFEDSEFIGALIRYKGTAPTTFIRTTFVNCKFLLVLPSRPQPQMELFASAILDHPSRVEIK